MAVLLEAARKGYWEPDAGDLQELALEYVRSLDRHGTSGSIRTTANRPFEEFVELRVASSEQPALVGVLLDELRDGGRPRVEGRMLVEQDAVENGGPTLFRPEAGLAALGILAGVFLLGWRRIQQPPAFSDRARE